MFVPFENMPGNARAWIYQADRQLTQPEGGLINERAKDFIDSWAAHGAPLRASFKVLHSQFLVILVDEKLNPVSGCSIDESVRFVQELENKMGVDFFDRTKVAFILEDEVFLESLDDLRNKVAEGAIQKDTLTFNVLAQCKKDLEDAWLVPAEQTWLGRYFK